MAGIKSLGIGSSNGLNMETINKLRSADESAIVKPIEKNIGKYEQKIESIGAFTKLLQAVKTDTSSIKDDFLYLQRTASVVGEGVSAIVEDGVEPQNINIKVEQLATEHIIQSDPFTSKNASVASEDSALTIKIGSSEHEFEIKAGMQLRDLVSEINDRAGHDVNASILQTGTKEFRLVLRTTETGSSNKIELIQGIEESTRPETTTQTITTLLPMAYDPYTGTPLAEPIDPATDLLITEKIDPLTGAEVPQRFSPYTGAPLPEDHYPSKDGALPKEYTSEDIEVVENVPVAASKLNVELYNEVQKPDNAHFIFNGAEITRESNEIDDMILGLTFTLEEVTGENKRVNIKIDQDTKQVLGNLQSFVNNYNSLMAEVDNMTKYDPDENEVGIFLGENTINSVRTSINNVLRQVGPQGESVVNIGFTFNRSGQLEFDSFAFEKALLDDPKMVQELLQGKKETKNGRDLQKDGIFYKLNEVIDDLVNSADGSIINFEKSLESQLKRTKKEKETAIKRLDDRYETMQNQFAAAGSAIGKLEKGFGAVDMQIKQSQASK